MWSLHGKVACNYFDEVLVNNVLVYYQVLATGASLNGRKW